VILDAGSGARLDQRKIADLLASAVTGRSNRQAAVCLVPWKRMGEYAVLKHDIVGPTTAGYHRRRLSPCSDWQAGWPWPFRQPCPC